MRVFAACFFSRFLVLCILPYHCRVCAWQNPLCLTSAASIRHKVYAQKCLYVRRRLADVISLFCFRLSLISLISSTFCFHSALLSAVSFAHASTKKMQQGSDCAMTTLVCVAKSVMQYQCRFYSSQGVRIRPCAKGTNSPSAAPSRDGGETRGRCATMEKQNKMHLLSPRKPLGSAAKTRARALSLTIATPWIRIST